MKASIFPLLLLSALVFLAGCSAGSKAVVETPQFLAPDSVVVDASKVEEEESPQDYYEADHLRMEDHVYDDQIKTVQLHPQGGPLAPPLLQLGQEGGLRLSFDDFSPELKDYSYAFIHCNADWEPSGMDANQVIDGLLEDDVVNYDYSRNTFQRYVHYDVDFPNRNFQFRISGNYLVKVYHSAEPEKLLLTRRFMVAEKKVIIKPDVKRGSRIIDRYNGQEVDFTLNFSQSYALTNPYTDLKVVVLQNQRWDNAITDLKPTFVKDKELVYDFDEKNVFKGGNEFRFFDVKDLQFRTESVSRLVNRQPDNHAYLVDDKKRAYLVYLDRPDINGKRLVSVGRNAWNPDVDGDYVTVHFTLDYPEIQTTGDFYVFGALTDWKFSPESRLVWNYGKEKYTASLYVKQGYYNYEYVFLGDGAPQGDQSMIEGSHYQTENEYSILVYHRTPGVYYDRLVAAETFGFPPDR